MTRIAESVNISMWSRTIDASLERTLCPVSERGKRLKPF